MAERLLRYFKFVRELKGLDGQVKLAQETRMPSVRAETEPDSPENLQRFRQAVKRIIGKDPPEF
jgi:hypothetical protein